MKKIISLLTAIALSLTTFVCYAEGSDPENVVDETVIIESEQQANEHQTGTNSENEIVNENETDDIVLLNDIEGHWAENSINKIMNMGIISGYPDGSFRPDRNVTRAELAKIVTIAFNLKDKDALDGYDDIDSSQWYYPYLEKAAKYIPKYRLVTAYPSMKPYENANNKFLPDNDVVRMHAAEALVKIKMETENIVIDIPDFFDIRADLLERFNNESHYQETFVMVHSGVPQNVSRMHEYTWLASELGIMQGNDEGHFDPYGYLTRAELVTIIDRMLQQ